MNDALATFSAGVADLRMFLEATAQEAHLIECLREHTEVLSAVEGGLIRGIAASHTNRRRYVYAVALVSLYGLLERFVEEVMVGYVREAAKLFDRYELLPGIIRDNHLSASIDLLRLIAEDRHRSGVSKELVIRNLHLCLSGAPDFTLNGEAFAIHRGNITFSKVAEFTTKLGIGACSKRILMSPEFTEWFERVEGVRDVRRLADDEVRAFLGPIDDLVERRNQLAHGVVVQDQIESIELLEERCEFLLTFCRSLFRVMREELMLFRIQRPDAVSLGKPIQVFKKDIACFEIRGSTIKVGDTLVAKAGDTLRPCLFGKVLSIQIDGVDMDQITASSPVKFGARLDFLAKKNWDFFLVPNERPD